MNTRARFNKTKMADINELKKLLEDVKRDLGEKIDNLAKKLDEKDLKITELENKIIVLESEKSFRDNQYDSLERRLDDSEQYSRRTSLRISGIPYNGSSV